MKVIKRLVSLKINAWKILIFTVLVVSLYYNYKQSRVISVYEYHYDYFDSVANSTLRELDTLRRIIGVVGGKEFIFTYLANNISKEYQMMYNEPEKFSDLYMKPNEMNLGGED